MHAEDVLETDFEKLRGDGPPLRVVGNLPYNISTPVLFRLLSQRSAIADMHFMLQKEVVDRMTAASGGKEYGRLTVMLGVYAAVERLFDVGPGAFKPPPKVWSAVVRLRPTPGPRFAIGSDAALRTLVTAAFSHRRKTLRNGLKSFLRETDFESCGIDPERRPETLEPAEFGRLGGALLSKRRRRLTQSGRIVPHSVILRFGWPIIEKSWCCWICPRAAKRCSTPPATWPRIRMPRSSHCTSWITRRSSPWAKR